MSSAFPFVIDRIALTANWSQRRARLTEYVLASTTFYGEKPFDILRLFSPTRNFASRIMLRILTRK